jgi:tetratricopeptide (TPR) repeat protein
VSRRLVVDRLWPMLLGLAALLAGALALEGWAARRGNDPIRITIADDASAGAAADDEGDAPAEPAVRGEPQDAPLSELHARARVAARRALWADAIPLYEKALAAHPGSPAVETELGDVLLAAGEPERALPHLEAAARLHPGAAALYRVGIAHARLGDKDGAERDLRAALDARPPFGPARVALGNLLRRRGRTAEALPLLQAAAAGGSNEERARALVALGAARLALGERAEAARAFDQAVLFAPARAEIRVGIARAWLSGDAKEDAGRAAEVLLRAAELAPDLAAVQTLLGRARERAGDEAGATEAYDRALRLDPGQRLARRRLLRLALAARDLPRARHEADRLVADGPAVPEHHFLAALVASADGRPDDARRAYGKAIESAKGDYPEAYLNLGVLEKNAGDLRAARAAYGKAIALRPSYAAAWHNLGKLAEAAADPREAEADYRKALAIDGRYAVAWLSLGQLLTEQRRLDEATAALRSALAARPGYEAAELSLGVVLARAAKPREAADAYRALLARAPRTVAAWYNLGLALEAEGKPGEARDALAQAVGVDPEHVPSWRELAELELAAGKLDDARRGFQEVLDLAPGDVGARVGLAVLAARSGDRPACEAAARRLRAEAPQDPDVAALATRCTTR